MGSISRSLLNTVMRPVPEYDAPTPNDFGDEIVPLGRPAVMRGIASAWPLVGAATQGVEPWLAMLSTNASEQPVKILRADPELHGRFHYTRDGRALNFGVGYANLRALLAALSEQAR